jgi:hypothetical protein
MLVAFTASAQIRAPAGREFQITKITKEFVSSPDYGIGSNRGTTNERWLQIEVEFNSATEWTDELTLKYYILFNNRLLTGEVTHTNIPGGLNRSVMYVLPVAIARPFLGDLPMVGRLFRSNVDQHIKRNLIIFVTARLVNPAGQPVNQAEEEEEGVEPPVLQELPAYKK